MNCAEAKLKLEPCASGTLAPEERIELQEHLAICEGCRLELELTRAVMGTPSFEGEDEPPAATPEAPSYAAPEAPSYAAPEAPSFATPEAPSSATPDVPPSFPQDPESRPQTALYDEMSFDDLGSEVPAAGSFPRVPPAGDEKASDPSEADPFANFTAKPDEPAEQSPAKWDFEPADVPRDSSPPEGSLSFANEALRRKHAAEEKRKVTLVRLALWGGGIGCGLVLLGVSVWIAFAFRQEKAPDLLPGGGFPSAAPQPETATPAPPEPQATPNASQGGAGQEPATTDPTTPAPAPSSSAPSPPVPTLLDSTPGVAPPPGPPPPGVKIAADGSTKTGSRATKPKPAAKGAAKLAPSATAPKGGSAGDEGEFPWNPVDDPPMTRPRLPEATSPQQTAPANPELSGGASEPNAGTAPPSPSPQPTAEPAPPAPEPAVMRPIDQLHLATEIAAKEADLGKLKKLKSSWKSLIASTAGPDRTRAKREYADCLWSIQEVSGRNSDRREALTAYRDYVLYAPAGGADSRTINRMRSLEEILTDSK